MKRLVVLAASAFLFTSEAADACGRCRVAQARPRRVACHSRPVVYRSPSVAYATLQVTYAAPTVVATPVMASTPITAPSAEVQPAYHYLAANQERPAYYYTYDNSGKLVVSQWVDWLFRGGRAEGMPRPPLPVIGALRGANR